MIEPKPEIVEEGSEESRFNKRKYLIIYSSIFFLVPSAIGIPLTAALQNGTYIESAYAIFGTISLLAGLFRSWQRDSKNIRKNHTIVEDKDTPLYREFSFKQWTCYVVGIVLLVLSVGSFYLCGLFGVTNPF